jgi:hypothetical protein
MELGKVRLTGRDFGSDPEHADRWTLRFPNGRRDDARAEIVADQLKCIESVNGMLWGMISLLPVRERLISKHRKLNVGRVVEDVARGEQGLALATEWREKLQHSMRRSSELDLFLWSSLPAMQDQMTERAVSFLHESHQRAWFANAHRWDMARCGPDHFESPQVPSEAARLESAVVSAFKAVEALIGTTKPSHIQQKLVLNRFEHARPVPFPPHNQLGLELSLLAKARDARAAHGSGSRKSAVTYYEVMGWQTCAQALVNQALLRGNSVRMDLIVVLRGRSLDPRPKRLAALEATTVATCPRRRATRHLSKPALANPDLNRSRADAGDGRGFGYAGPARNS